MLLRTVFFALVLSLSGVIPVAASPRAIAQQIKPLLVRLVGKNFWQTGVIIARQENTYWVLTCAEHSVKDLAGVQIYTAPSNPPQPLTSQPQGVADSPLVLLPFAAPSALTLPVFSSLEQPSEGEAIYIAGFVPPNPREKDSPPEFYFSDGLITQLGKQGKTFSHNGTALANAPIWDSSGELLGIQCPNRAIFLAPLLSNLTQQGRDFGFSPYGIPPRSPRF
jgi:hypothetical protein